jgi:hypothetical protein
MKTLIALALVTLSVTFAQTQTGEQLDAPGTSTSQEHGPEHVQPGLVQWHADRESALAAAKESGRPVLIFQMLGRLDELFC